jgi:thiol-disulfide isomerase/thioredoxin
MTAFWRAPAGVHVASARLPDEGELASFDDATGWLNSKPLTPAGLRGKVVLIDFWTYTCINWLRQLPYVRGWAEKYSSHGLVVIGVHTPEFSFEHNADNVRRAVQDLRINYPVATDKLPAASRRRGQLPGAVVQGPGKRRLPARGRQGRAHVPARHPALRRLTRRAIAEMARRYGLLFLESSPYITGEILHIDGGQVAGH